MKEDVVENPSSPEERGGVEGSPLSIEERVVSKLSSLVEKGEEVKQVAQENAKAKEELHEALGRLSSMFRAYGVELDRALISIWKIPVEADVTFTENGMNIDFIRGDNCYAVHSEPYDVWVSGLVELFEEILAKAEEFKTRASEETKVLKKIAEVLKTFTCMVKG